MIESQKYVEELAAMQDSEGILVELSPLEAVAICNHIQLAGQHTSNCKITQIAITGAKRIQKSVLDPESTAYAVLEAGWGAIEN
jgi:hypothetical protein